MLAKRVDDLPSAGAWIFEPKWDGFRALIFRDGDEIEIQSRDAKPLNRYFPEVVDALRAQLPTRCVLDGEIVIARMAAWISTRSSFACIPRRRASSSSPDRVPASVVLFDLLSEGNQDLCGGPFNNGGSGWKRCFHPRHRLSM